MPNPLTLRARLQRLLAPHQTALNQPGAADALHQAITTAAIERARRHIAAIRLYQLHPAQRDISDPPVIWRHGTTRLLYYGLRDHDPVVLVIPSLINRCHIMDLEATHSFVRFLAAQGLRPLLIDWDEPGAMELAYGLDDYLGQKLLPLLQWLQQNVSATPCHILGYCMGGNLALALTALAPERARSLTLLATPWDFAARHFQYPPNFQALLPAVQRLGYLSIDALQTLFSALQPEQALKKFLRFAAMDWDSAVARRFVLVEDWLNDGVILPAKVAEECLAGWYGANLPYQNQWRVAGRIIDPRQIKVPSYVVLAGLDRIVPPSSSRPLGQLLPNATTQDVAFGHVGLMASDKAPAEVWTGLVKWLKETNRN